MLQGCCMEAYGCDARALKATDAVLLALKNCDFRGAGEAAIWMDKRVSVLD